MTKLTYRKALHRVRSSAILNPHILAWQLRLDTLNGVLAGYFSGSTIKHFPQVAMQGYRVRVPPREEQQRIADKLDTVLARVDACRDRLARVAPLLKRFRQSVLAAATSGGLTEDWRSGATLGDASSELLLLLTRRALHEKRPPAAPDLSHSAIDAPAGWVVASVHQFAECLDRLRIPIKRDDRKNVQGLHPYYGANGEVGRIVEFIFDDELVLVTEDETFYVGAARHASAEAPPRRTLSRSRSGPAQRLRPSLSPPPDTAPPPPAPPPPPGRSA